MAEINISMKYLHLAAVITLFSASNEQNFTLNPHLNAKPAENFAARHDNKNKHDIK